MVYRAQKAHFLSFRSLYHHTSMYFCRYKNSALGHMLILTFGDVRRCWYSFPDFRIQNMIVSHQEKDWSWPTWLQRLLALPSIFQVILSSGWAQVGKYKNKFSACYLARIHYIPLKTALLLQTFWLFPPFLKILGGLWGGLDLDLMGTRHMSDSPILTKVGYKI